MTDAELWDYLQERFGIGDWDEATSRLPWWKFRANEIGKLKVLMRKRRTKPHELIVTADYAVEHHKPVTALWQVFALIPEAMADLRRQQADLKTSRRIAEVETAIAEAMELGETEWAERLMRVSTDQSETVVNQWRNR